MNLPHLTAHWIWHDQANFTPYQQVIYARKIFQLAQPVQQAHVRITTDGWYRLFVNGQWVADGPCRSWPEHFQYDVLDVTKYLEPSDNEFWVTARHWNAGNFHTIPQQAGLLVQLDAELADGDKLTLGSDGDWETAEASGWVAETPKVSIQMEPQEMVDARLGNEPVFTPARILYTAQAGPWKDLQPRDVALLTRQPVGFTAFVAANVVQQHSNLAFCVPATRLVHPGVVEANQLTSSNGGMAALLRLAAPGVIQLETEGLRVAIDGVEEPGRRWTLDTGTHLVLAFASSLFGHLKELSLRFVNPPAGLSLKNISHPSSPNPWCWVDLPEYTYLQKDLQVSFAYHDDPGIARRVKAYQTCITTYLADTKDEYDFLDTLVRYSRCPQMEDMFVTESHWQFLARQPLAPAGDLVSKPEALLPAGDEVTTVYPSPDGDIELAYDLGEQRIGYLDFELTAAAGVEVDFYEVEYITPQGLVQHTWANRNGMRYITREGTNRFTSLKRRSGRYLFITLHHQHTPVHFRHVQIIESTYPVEAVGKFACSDARLDRIWEISERTLKLCMEDTFTDCPLYEQTLWVGDARNEALYAYNLYGADDLARRCIRLAALSLERYPITGCQVPSAWDILLPAWSFLWTIAVWEEYFFHGDLAQLAETWHWVVRNLQGAEGLLDEHGLFSGPFWNMFDWSGMDDRQNTVLHNSMLLVGAIQAGQKMAAALNEPVTGAWLAQLHQRLVEAINHWWDADRRAYPDSLLPDGTPSPVISMHTSFLALLYDIATPEIAPHAWANTLTPPTGMVPIGSPFAMQYYYETLDKIGRQDEIMASIYANYLPMLETGSTTVWEVFPGGTNRPEGFPTRSHCHAWSAAPLYFLPRLALGIRQVEAGGEAFEISPYPGELTWARGSIATRHGTLTVDWEVEGNRLKIRVDVPEGVNVTITSNPALETMVIERII